MRCDWQPVQGWKRRRNRRHCLRIFSACVVLAQLGILYTDRIPPLFAYLVMERLVKTRSCGVSDERRTF